MAPSVILPIHIKNIKAITYDILEHSVYWIDGKNFAIKKAFENGSNIQTVVPNHHDMHSPYDMVLDSFSRMLIWSCLTTNSLNVTRLDGHIVGPIISNNIDRPRLLALHYRKK